MGDETTKIFLNSKGKCEGIDSDLAAILDYIEGKASKGNFTANGKALTSPATLRIQCLQDIRVVHYDEKFPSSDSICSSLGNFLVCVISMTLSKNVS